MRKKFFAVYALVGALVASPVFTSCVDDTESESVTAIRNAKAEQLKATAELNKAQAAVQAIEAEAYAAYQKGYGAWYQAQADEKNQKTKEAAEKYARELEKIQLDAQLAYLEAQQSILAYQQSLADGEITRFSTLMSNYTSALSTLTGYKSQLTQKQGQLAGLENGLTTAEATNKKTIYEKEQLIKQNEAIIALLKDPAYATLDNTELAAKLAVATKEFELAKKTFNANEPTITALIEAGALYKEKMDAMTQMSKNISALNNLYPNLVQGVGGSSASNYYYYNAATYNGASLVAGGEELSFSAGQRTIKEADILTAKRSFEATVTEKAKALGKDTDTKTTETEEGSGVLTAYAQMAAANAQMAEAEALTDAAAKKTAVELAEVAIANAKDNLNSALKQYNEAVEKQTKFNEALAAVGNQEAIDKVVAEKEAAYKAQQAALEAFNEAKNNGSVKEKEIAKNAIQALINNSSEDIQQSIINAEKNIADAKKAIEDAKVANQEQAIANLKAEIADLEYKIELQEKLVAEHKALLDAYLAEDETEEA